MLSEIAKKYISANELLDTRFGGLTTGFDTRPEGTCPVELADSDIAHQVLGMSTRTAWSTLCENPGNE